MNDQPAHAAHANGAYVILRHRFVSGQSSARTAADHTDWMFDNGETLWTWASDQTLPHPDEPFSDRVFEKLADHRRAYLEYEGPVAGNRGYVERIEQGHYQLIVHNDERFELQLSGGRSGVLVLVLQRTLVLPEAPGSDWKGAFRPTRADAS